MIRSARPLLPLLGALTLLVACAGTDAGGGAGADPGLSPTAGQTSAVVPGDGALALMLDFDGLTEGALQEGIPVFDVSGNGNDALLAMPADVTDVPTPLVFADGEGRAVQFPDPCDVGPDCRRGILEVQSSPELNPSVSSFSFGVDVRLDSEDIRSGANLVQKGFSTGDGGQWKVQVDDKEGHPTCVLVDSLDNEFLEVRSSVAVSDGDWHSIICERSATELTVSVDGGVTGSVSSGEVFLIENESPVRIAGKHLKENGDFYFGDVDNVFVRIGGG